MSASDNLCFILCAGEEPLSYGYGGTGKASTDCKFKDYGKPFHVGDVVGAILVSIFYLSMWVLNSLPEVPETRIHLNCFEILCSFVITLCYQEHNIKKCSAMKYM